MSKSTNCFCRSGKHERKDTPISHRRRPSRNKSMRRLPSPNLHPSASLKFLQRPKWLPRLKQPPMPWGRLGVTRIRRRITRTKALAGPQMISPIGPSTLAWWRSAPPSQAWDTRRNSSTIRSIQYTQQLGKSSMKNTFTRWAAAVVRRPSVSTRLRWWRTDRNGSLLQRNLDSLTQHNTIRSTKNRWPAPPRSLMNQAITKWLKGKCRSSLQDSIKIWDPSRSNLTSESRKPKSILSPFREASTSTATKMSGQSPISKTSSVRMLYSGVVTVTCSGRRVTPRENTTTRLLKYLSSVKTNTESNPSCLIKLAFNTGIVSCELSMKRDPTTSLMLTNITVTMQSFTSLKSTPIRKKWKNKNGGSVNCRKSSLK